MSELVNVLQLLEQSSWGWLVGWLVGWTFVFLLPPDLHTGLIRAIKLID